MTHAFEHDEPLQLEQFVPHARRLSIHTTTLTGGSPSTPPFRPIEPTTPHAMMLDPDFDTNVTSALGWRSPEARSGKSENGEDVKRGKCMFL